MSLGHLWYLEQLHPNDLEEFTGPVFHYFINYSTLLTKEKLTTNRFSVNYRIKNAQGIYIHFLDKHIVLETDENNYPVLMMGICNDISNYKTDDKIVFSVMEFDDSNSLQLVSSKIFPENTKLTPREREVLIELKNGATSKDIAKRLSVSLHTINAHRRNLLEKFKFKNTSELISYCVTKGIVCFFNFFCVNQLLDFC